MSTILMILQFRRLLLDIRCSCRPLKIHCRIELFCAGNSHESCSVKRETRREDSCDIVYSFFSSEPVGSCIVFPLLLFNGKVCLTKFRATLPGVCEGGGMYVLKYISFGSAFSATSKPIFPTNAAKRVILKTFFEIYITHFFTAPNAALNNVHMLYFSIFFH